MHIDAKPLDLSAVLWATSNGQELVESCRDVANDPRAAERRKTQECVRCFYWQRVGAATGCDTECALCGKGMDFGSTAVDRLCLECAKAHRLCKHCGADIELRRRRKL